MNAKQLQSLVEEVRSLVQYPEVEGETTLEDWISEGDTEGMSPADIAAEWDNLSAQAENDTDE